MASAEPPPAAAEHPRLARAADALVYAALVALLSFLLALPVSLLLGAGLVGVKFALFLAGFLQLGLSVARLWPSDPDDLAVTGGKTREDETAFQRVVQRLLPAGVKLHPRHRLATPYRLFVAGLLTLAVSLALEQLFGVAA